MHTRRCSDVTRGGRVKALAAKQSGGALQQLVTTVSVVTFAHRFAWSATRAFILENRFGGDCHGV